MRLDWWRRGRGVIESEMVYKILLWFQTILFSFFFGVAIGLVIQKYEFIRDVLGLGSAFLLTALFYCLLKEERK